MVGDEVTGAKGGLPQVQQSRGYHDLNNIKEFCDVSLFKFKN
jgi:hypothetical protein